MATADLPEESVLVQVNYSSLNYKDALAVTGRGKIIRKFPMIPGIDFAGTVVESSDKRYSPGAEVVLTGWGVGETHWGGLAQLARISGDWLCPLPVDMSQKQAMAIGTAGFTAMLSIHALKEHRITPDRGEIVVTGATGGVGSIAIALLSDLGYNVIGVTGRPAEAGYLKGLGASGILDREALRASASRPLDSERWAGAIDVVGGEMLSGILSSMKRGGCVAACGLAGGHELHSTVFPFILRGVALCGIDSVYCPGEKRLQIWQAIRDHMRWPLLADMIHTVPLEKVPEACEDLLAGKVRGRLVVELP